MADCPDTNTQKIEYSGLSTLAQSKILRAEIDSIDEVNNCASVTLLDTCEATTGFDFSVVPFDYLCDNKADRTADALLYGYKAFANEDMIYLLFLHEADSAGNQAYIIGHVDIRETKKCQVQEYVVMTISENSTPHATIFDIENSCTLDLSTFVSKTGSPTPPASFPCIKDATFDTWFAYNFSEVTDVDDTISSISTYYESTESSLNSTDSNDLPLPVCPEQFLYYEHTEATYTGSYTDGRNYSLYKDWLLTEPGNEPGWCYYRLETFTLTVSSDSGNRSGFVFTDIAGGGDNIYIHLAISHNQESQETIREGALHTFMYGDETFSIDLVYPYTISGAGTNIINSLSLSYTGNEVRLSYNPWSHYTPYYGYISLDSTAAENPLNSSSRFFGDYGMYYIRPMKYVATNNSNTWYRWIGIIALKSDVGEITETNPLVVSRYLQNIDYDRSVAFVSTATELFTAHGVSYAYSGNFHTCPCQF